VKRALLELSASEPFHVIAGNMVHYEFKVAFMRAGLLWTGRLAAFSSKIIPIILKQSSCRFELLFADGSKVKSDISMWSIVGETKRAILSHF
jgi:hypothetical protein